MSRSGEVTLPFGDGDHTFRLGIGQWRKVQEQCDAGPSEVLARMSMPFEAMRRGVKPADLIGAGLLGSWRVDDIRSVLLNGLIGGGLSPVDATKLVAAWVDERPLLEPLSVAYQVVHASIAGTEDEDASGELEGETAQRPSPEANSGSDRTASTPSAAPRGSRPGKSTSAASGSSSPTPAASRKRTGRKPRNG